MGERGRCYLVLAVLCTLLATGNCWWPFGDTTEEEGEVAKESGGGVETSAPVPFEMTTAEKRFLAEAQQYLDLPPLERCQYQVRRGLANKGDSFLVCKLRSRSPSQVIARLRQSCGEMGEETMGKLSVALLNCQSEAEHRPTFACTEDMVSP